MAKIFRGSVTYEVKNSAEAVTTMDRISKSALGVLWDNPTRETGYYVDRERPIPIGEGRCLYPILGAMSDKRYAETNDPDLFE